MLILPHTFRNKRIWGKKLMGQHVEVFPHALRPDLFPSITINILLIWCLVNLFPRNQPTSFHHEKGKSSRNKLEMFWMKGSYAWVIVWCRLFLILEWRVFAYVMDMCGGQFCLHLGSREACRMLWLIQILTRLQLMCINKNLYRRGVYARVVLSKEMQPHVVIGNCISWWASFCAFQRSKFESSSSVEGDIFQSGITESVVCVHINAWQISY